MDTSFLSPLDEGKSSAKPIGSPKTSERIKQLLQDVSLMMKPHGFQFFNFSFFWLLFGVATLCSKGFFVDWHGTFLTYHGWVSRLQKAQTRTDI